MSFRVHAFLAFIAGVAAALGHAPLGLWWLAVPGFAGLIWLVAQGRPIGSRHRAGWLAWFGGVGYFGVAMHWIVEPFLVDIETHGWMAPGALILLAGGLALFWALAAGLAMRLADGPVLRPLAFAVLLTAAELARGHVFTGFPWALPAYIWADTPLLGAVSVTGSYGLTLLTLVGAALPSMLWTRGVGVALAGLVFGALFMLGQDRLNTDQGTRTLGTVRLVQPNIPQAEKWERDKVPVHLDRLMALSREPGEDGQAIDLVIWPEAAVVYPLDQAGAVLAEALDAAQEGAGADAGVILGINRRSAAGDWFNALVVLGADGTLKETYDKVHLVPFGEYIPFRINFLRAMAASSGFGFTPGERARLIDTPLGKALPLICYEGIFPRHLFLAGARPDYLLLITNDAWFGTFSGPYQHLDQARFRAVEHGLPVVRVANTGVSAVISRFGDVGSSIALGEAGYLDQQVDTSLAPTVYARTGDWPVIGILLVSLGGLFIARRRNAIAKRTSSV